MSDYCKIQGHCPMGCGQMLFVGQGGHVTCSWIDCPDPSAVDTILAYPETEHIVEFGLGDFNLQHPLRERINGALFDCAVHQHIARLDGPPVRPGKYRATVDDDGRITWTAASS